MGTAILVTGGTGTLGRPVVRRLLAAGHDVRVLSRRAHADNAGVRYMRGDLVSDVGVAAAVTGTAVVVHCASGYRGDEVAASHLIRAMSSVGPQADPAHLVYISIVGVERLPYDSTIDRALFGYYRAKYGVEQLLAASGLPWTILRATQFHDLIFRIVRAGARLPVVPVPTGFRFQPVDVDVVAARLVELALAPAAGIVADIGGPRSYAAADLLHSYLRARRIRRASVPLHLPGAAAAAMRGGANLSLDNAQDGRTWEDYLRDRVAGTEPA